MTILLLEIETSALLEPKKLYCQSLESEARQVKGGPTCANGFLQF